MEHQPNLLVFQVTGMTCSGCERKLERGLSKLSGVSDVKASLAEASIRLYYDPEIVKPERLLAEVDRLGYSATVAESGSAGSDAPRRKLQFKQLLGLGIIVAALYWLMTSTWSAAFLPQVDASVGYGMLFGIGILTSLHCIAMCGGINLAQSIPPAGAAEPEKTFNWENLKPSLLYNSGRVVSYTVIGGLVGAVGSVFSFSSAAKGLVTVVSGVLMVLLGLKMLNLIPWLRRFRLSGPRFLGEALEAQRSNRGPFWVGLLNGLMPCGPLQTMQLYALGSGSFWGGALAMLLFSLGTVPLMFGFGAISAWLSRQFTSKLLKVSAVLVVVLGLVMVNRGLSLSGNPLAVTKDRTAATVAQLQGKIQVVTTGFDQGRYQPLVVQKGVPLRWIIKARPEDLNGCNNPVTVPEYGIERRLVPGDNIIEFTPAREGNITYTCWMGMISSTIKVVADLGRVSGADLAPPVNNSGRGGGCCAF